MKPNSSVSIDFLRNCLPLSKWWIMLKLCMNSLKQFSIICKMQQQDKWAASWQNQQCCCAPSEDSAQHGHPPSLIRVFAVRMKKAWVLSYPLSAQRRSDWKDAQADLSLSWAPTRFVCFVVMRLKYVSDYFKPKDVHGIRVMASVFGLISVLRPFNTFYVISGAVSYPNHTVSM